MLGPLDDDSDVSRREFVLEAALAAGAVGIAGMSALSSLAHAQDGSPPNEAG